MLGKGLESLIPQKKVVPQLGGFSASQNISQNHQQSNSQNPQQNFQNAPQRNSFPPVAPATKQPEHVPNIPKVLFDPTFEGQGVGGFTSQDFDEQNLDGQEEKIEETKTSLEPLKQSDAIFQIEVGKIKPNPFQPRKEFDQDALSDLAQSIREFGVIQPLVVSKVEKETATGTDVEYELIAGERRLQASKIAGLERVPVIVKRVDRDRMKLEMALIENIQRSELTPIETARSYSRLQDEFGLTQREIASRVGKSREAVANSLRLLNLPIEMQNAVGQHKISESQARVLLSINNSTERQKMFEQILSNKMSVRAIKDSSAKTKDVVNSEEQYWEKRLEERLGSTVKVSKKGPAGKIIIQFYSDEEWKAVLDKLQMQAE